LKATSAEKYLEMMKVAGYIEERRSDWGAREIIVYEITPLGRERYDWFRKINDELFVSGDG
jgi:DNA-binding PadR family transcriptional regulator